MQKAINVHLLLTAFCVCCRIKRKQNITRIILRIRLKRFYWTTVNCLTTSESVPRVPHDISRHFVYWYYGLRPSGTGTMAVLHRWDKNPGGEVSLII